MATLWARPCDSYGTPICLQFAPRDVMHSGWVGDQKGNWDGIKGAIFNFVHSAWQNFASYGSDIGGYLNGDNSAQGRTKELFIRWAQMGAFTPHMENGGNGEHRPWMFDSGSSTETADVYRTFVHIHTELIPYFLTAGMAALENKTSVLFPLASKSDILALDTYDYKLWHDILVCPITDGNVTSRQITFPKGDNWVDWWNPSSVYTGGTKVNFLVPNFEVFPVFQRQGSILPINVTSQFAGHGSEASADALTLLVNGIDMNRLFSQAVVRGEYPNGISREISYNFDANSGSLRFTGTAHSQPVIILLRGIRKCAGGSNINIVNHLLEKNVSSFGEIGSGTLRAPSSVKERLHVGKTSLAMQWKLRRAGEGSWFDSDRSELWIRPGAADSGLNLSVSCVSNL